ncbi:MAG: alpha/beta hydrolase [Candidatus Sumerlaeota bacterium]|nr:alpha/beta hydrolase [Candidatus Sumerlaeota bacterium]
MSAAISTAFPLAALAQSTSAQKWRNVAWHEDYAAAQQTATQDNKPILVVLMLGDMADASGPGRKLPRGWSPGDDNVARLVNMCFVPVWLDIAKSGVPDAPALTEARAWLSSVEPGDLRQITATSLYLGSMALTPDGKKRLNDSDKSWPWKYKESAPSEYMKMLHVALDKHEKRSAPAASLSIPSTRSTSSTRSTQSTLSTPPTPPAQPKQGPGGANYKHANYTARKYGKAATGYWLYEPASPTPTTAPLIVFNHGWLAYIPGGYLAWTEHLVKRGNIVVYPLYQDSPFTVPEKFTPNAIQGVKDAIQELQTGRHPRPDLSKFAIVGHSAGGVITADMAVRTKTDGLPAPKAVMVTEAGRGSIGGKPNIPMDDYSKMASDALLLVVITEAYPVNDEAAPAELIFKQAPIPADNKNLITLMSDDRGHPDLIADHFAGCGNASGRRRAEVDALDYYGYWKLFDALCDAAFYGRNRTTALGNTPEQKFMGRWSDGVAVRELRVTGASEKGG